MRQWGQSPLSHYADGHENETEVTVPNVSQGQRILLSGTFTIKDDAVREHYRVLLRLVMAKNPQFIEAISGDTMSCEAMDDVLMEIVKDVSSIFPDRLPPDTNSAAPQRRIPGRV